ncbi:MAG: hypothetical protein Q6370_008665 [Candidatus Sigynarchaeota archaeon]
MANIQAHRQSSLDMSRSTGASVPRKHDIVKKAELPGLNTSFLSPDIMRWFSRTSGS